MWGEAPLGPEPRERGAEWARGRGSSRFSLLARRPSLLSVKGLAWGESVTGNAEPGERLPGGRCHGLGALSLLVLTSLPVSPRSDPSPLLCVTATTFPRLLTTRHLGWFGQQEALPSKGGKSRGISPLALISVSPAESSTATVSGLRPRPHWVAPSQVRAPAWAPRLCNGTSSVRPPPRRW